MDSGGYTMTEADKKFTLRLPEDLHTALNVLAERDMRSLHAEVVYFLRAAVGEELDKLAAAIKEDFPSSQ
jgi:hypothetical protein